MEQGSWLADRIMKSKKPHQNRNLLAVRRLVPHSRTTLDVGANVGLTAIEYAEFSDKVFAFEPHPVTFDRLTRTIAENAVSNIVPINLGVGDKAETQWMHIDKSNDGSNWIARRGAGTQIKMTRLDDWGWRDVDFIKFDIEGFELLALSGAEQLIRTCRPVVQCEISQDQLKRYGASPQQVFDWFIARGYAIENYQGSARGPTWTYEPRVIDYFFVPGAATE